MLQPRKPYKRNQRLNKEVSIIISDYLHKEFSLVGCGVITISKVRISRDITNAKIYFSVLSNTLSLDEITDALNKKAGLIKGIIGRSIRTKHVPNIKFIYDDSFEYSENINRILSKINK